MKGDDAQEVRFGLKRLDRRRARIAIILHVNQYQEWLTGGGGERELVAVSSDGQTERERRKDAAVRP